MSERTARGDKYTITKKSSAKPPPVRLAAVSNREVVTKTSRAYFSEAYSEGALSFVLYFLFFVISAVADLVSELSANDNAYIVTRTLYTGLTKGLVVYVVFEMGSLTNTGLANPLWTIAKFALGKMRLPHGQYDFAGLLVLLLVEVLTSLVASFTVHLLFSDISGPWYGVPHVDAFELGGISTASAFISEFIGSLILTMAVIFYGIEDDLYGHKSSVVSALFAAASAALAVFCGAVFNPLLHLAPAIAAAMISGDDNAFSATDWIYYVAPLVGTVAAVVLYQLVFRLLNLGNAIYFASVIKDFMKDGRRKEFLQRNRDAITQRYQDMSDAED
jgi:glycerol uptake facilitator-like aquaporin